MTSLETPRLLYRLLKRQAMPLLETFGPLMPGCSLALIDQDGSSVAQIGSWPESLLTEAILQRLAAANSSSSENSPHPPAPSPDLGEAVGSPSDGAQAEGRLAASPFSFSLLSRQEPSHSLVEENCRAYSLWAEEVLAGALVVAGKPVDAVRTSELALYRCLELLITQGLERRAIVDDTLNRYRELNLLYRVGETIGTALDPELIPQLVLKESRRVIPADVGVEVGVFLERIAANPAGGSRWINKASFGSTEQVSALLELMRNEIDRLLDSGQPAIVTDFPFDLPAEMLRYRAVLWAPLRTPQEVLGGILLGRLWDQPIFTANDEKLLTSLALQSALALENAHLFAQTDEKLARRVQELTTLQCIDRQLNETLDYEHVLMLTVEFAAGAGGVQSARLLLPDEERELFKVAGHYDHEEAALLSEGAGPVGKPFLRSAGNLKQVGRNGYVDREDPLVAGVLRSRQVESIKFEIDGDVYIRLGIPIWRKGSVVGLLEVMKNGQEPFDPETVTFLTQLADHSALAIDNARLYAAAQQEINRRRAAEEQLRQHAVALEARNAELDAFGHTVAHDLKAPLSIIAGFADMLDKFLEMMSTEELRKHLQAIVENGRIMSSIIDELLLLAGIRKQNVDLTPLYNMADLVAGAQDRLSHLIHEYQAKIVGPETWPVALGYGPWVEEVWANYLSNAIKYGDQPPHIEVGATVQENGMVRFWVRDNGPGLTPEEQANLFVPFTQLNKIRVQGHGLGLSIVRRIVERLGGQVGVESRVDQGSIFYFTLPGNQS